MKLDESMRDRVVARGQVLCKLLAKFGAVCSVITPIENLPTVQEMACRVEPSALQVVRWQI